MIGQRWTKSTLTLADYEFAISNDRERWQCMAHGLNSKVNSRQARYLAVDMYWWEMWREVIDTKLLGLGSALESHYDDRAFLALEENRQRVDAALNNPSALKTKPADWPPLEEVSLSEAATLQYSLAATAIDPQSKHRLIAETLSVHSFKIFWLENNNQIEQRFHNWRLFRNVPVFFH